MCQRKNAGSKWDLFGTVYLVIIYKNTHGSITMLGQLASRMSTSSDGVHSFSVTVQVQHRDVMAEIALFHVRDYGQATITQIVSNDGVEEPNEPIIFRRGTTSVTFTLLVAASGASARWFINFWS
jgi:hypothetical protein